MDCSHRTWAGGGPAEIVADVALTEQRSGLWHVVIQAEASLTHVAQRYSGFSGKQTLLGTEDGQHTVTLRKPDRVCKYPCI